MPSQCGQDLLVLEVLEGLTGGYFLDAGASDGVRSSNTHLLEATFGWQGICVEPNTAYFAALVKNRHCICVNCCLYHTEGQVDFLEDAQQLGGILEAYYPSHLRYAKSAFHIGLSEDGRPPTVIKKARTVRSILDENRAPKTIDYWSLDTEGSELTILKSFPFEEYSFRVLTVEHNWLPVREEIKTFLAGHSYQRIRALDIDDCYVHSELVARPTWRSRTWRSISRNHSR